MKTPYILIVIPFKGQIDLTIECLMSLRHSYISNFYYSIIMWDDGSSIDDLNKLYYNRVFNELMIVRNEHVGYTQAVYNAFQFAKNNNSCDYILLCNNDIVFKTNTLFSLNARMTSNPNIAAVGCKVLKYGSDVILHTGTRIKNNEIEDPYVGLQENDPKTNFVERRLWVNGCCSLYNAHILRKENLNFNLDFKECYFEEADLMSQFNLLGYSVLYEPRAKVEHVMNATHSKEREKYEKIFWGNWNKYLTKWKPYFNSKSLQF